ncbi:MAG TPA: hypothetical protein VFL16_08255 [Steroidobacteraceae bacterium]|jgi:hypothetical protein|nr:hypothetical protein [Steroidobacteraceae bacterium]
MSPESWPVVLGPLLAALIALPALGAMHRRRRSRECSDVAAGLAQFAAAVRGSPVALELDARLLERARRLAIPEMLGFEFARELPRPQPALLADAAQRLALRLKRRVAFERKMLARTAAGRWRGAVAGTCAALALLSMQATGMALPTASVLLVLVLQGIGCWLLWRVTHVGV